VEPLVFVKGLEDIELDQVGLEAVFDCEITKESVKAQWFKDSKAIRKSDNIDISSKAGIHKLTIKAATPDDIGQYSIKLADVTSEAKLTIKGK
jgi:hypothetical protein